MSRCKHCHREDPITRTVVEQSPDRHVMLRRLTLPELLQLAAETIAGDRATGAFDEIVEDGSLVAELEDRALALR